MKIVGLFILVLSSNVFADECIYNRSQIAGFNYEQIMSYSHKVQEKACVNTIMDDARKDSSPQAKVLHASFVVQQKLETATEKDWEEVGRVNKEACKQGFVDACVIELGTENKSKEELDKLMLQYCEKNSAQACLYIGFSLNKDGKQKGDKYIQKACKLNSALSCDHLKKMEEIRNMGKLKK